ncbi:hypothetical protein ABID13_002670 [Enterocloster citroniae]|uniref:Stage V sporulation protein SpoVM n=1 Tax=Enterocloster citroniae TaxID=358743 RepID=A0ABV2FYE2_9FIRM
MSLKGRRSEIQVFSFLFTPVARFNGLLKRALGDV